MTEPTSAQELADVLAAAASIGQTVGITGASSKAAFGPACQSDVCLSTIRLNQVLLYEPRDLTISVQAGMPWADLTVMLAANRQMIPLDPPLAHKATVGGVIATNASGPRRRLYGTARDLVIGMTFGTIDGQLINTGGMVVKNVAGLDMAKLMIGSRGTLGAITSVNFKLAPMPEGTRTWIRRYAAPADAFAQRDAILQSVLQPQAIDLLNPGASSQLGLDRWTLLVRAGGSGAVLNRYSRELAGFEPVQGNAELRLWQDVIDFMPRYLTANPTTTAVRVSSSLSDVRRVMESLPGPAIARAGSGVTYGYFSGTWTPPTGCSACIEAGPVGPAWNEPGDDLAMMQQVKEMMDPKGLLNRGRFYGRF